MTVHRHPRHSTTDDSLGLKADQHLKHTPYKHITYIFRYHPYAHFGVNQLVNQYYTSQCTSEFHSNITHLQNALQQISSWMTANLLTLNSSKTEFLLIGLKQQLSKIHNSSLTTTHCARSLGFIFDEHLTFSDQISALSKSCYYHISELRCICRYLDFKTTSTIAALSILSLITVTLSITTFQTINLTGSNRSRTLFLLLLLRLLNPHLSLAF